MHSFSTAEGTSSIGERLMEAVEQQEHSLEGSRADELRRLLAKSKDFKERGLIRPAPFALPKQQDFYELYLTR